MTLLSTSIAHSSGTMLIWVPPQIAATTIEGGPTNGWSTSKSALYVLLYDTQHLRHLVDGVVSLVGNRAVSRLAVGLEPEPRAPFVRHHYPQIGGFSHDGARHGHVRVEEGQYSLVGASSSTEAHRMTSDDSCSGFLAHSSTAWSIAASEPFVSHAPRP